MDELDPARLQGEKLGSMWKLLTTVSAGAAKGTLEDIIQQREGQKREADASATITWANILYTETQKSLGHPSTAGQESAMQ